MVNKYSLTCVLELKYLIPKCVRTKQPKKNSTKNTGYTAFKFPDLVIKKCLIPKKFLDNVSEMRNFLVQILHVLTSYMPCNRKQNMRS